MKNQGADTIGSASCRFREEQHTRCMDSFDPLTFSSPNLTTVELLPKPSTVQSILAFSKAIAHVPNCLGDGWLNQN